MIFLRYADLKFTTAKEEIEAQDLGTGRRTIGKQNYHSKGVLYVPDEARFSYLQQLPEGEDMGAAINTAMKLVEGENDELKDVLPKNYTRIDDSTLIELVRILGSIPAIEGDAFGKIYEYFLGKFAMKEGQKGGEFFTPTSLVRLIVAILQPYHGRIYDPASGSGGMFVQSARFVLNHQQDPGKELSVFGQERGAETIRLAKMNLAVHGLSGDIRQGNTYYEDLHDSFGRFDFVMANPPFNVSGVDKERIKDDPRFSLGMSSTDNANYLWIQIFYHSLNEQGRTGFVMANSAADARGAELAIRKKIIESGAVDTMIAISPNFFYTVTLPCTLWFFDRSKTETDRKDKVLFIDARHTFVQVDRAHREFSPEQIEFLANIARLSRGEPPEYLMGSEELTAEHFPDGVYQDIPGLCKVATTDDVEEQGWSLNPGRYVGITPREDDGFDFKERLGELNEELEVLNAEARELEDRIAENVVKLIRI
jgi:type I restriction enzyme M protein